MVRPFVDSGEIRAPVCYARRVNQLERALRMFESVKHWFESASEDQHVFHHADDQLLHIALASLLFHIISADEVESAKEKRMFADILRTECDLNDEQIAHLYDRAKSLKSDVHSDLETISHYLKDNPMLRTEFMSKLNQLVNVDWVREKELETFNEALHVFFPDIKET
jgi:uncharacterized tellurite resistance protein B-like protein